MISGLAMTSGPVLVSSRSISSTTTRRSSPICGAARPMPGAAYIVSSMSSMSWRTPASTVCTGRDFFLRRGSGAVRMVLRAMVLKYAVNPGFSRPIRRRSVTLDHGADARLGEELEQQGMRHPSVHDGGSLDAAVHRVD